MNGKVHCFDGVNITRFLIRTTRLGMNSGLLMAKPAAKTLFTALRRTHISLRPMRGMGGKRHFSVGLSGVHPDSGLCGLISISRLGGFGNKLWKRLWLCGPVALWRCGRRLCLQTKSRNAQL